MILSNRKAVWSSVRIEDMAAPMDSGQFLVFTKETCKLFSEVKDDSFQCDDQVLANLKARLENITLNLKDCDNREVLKETSLLQCLAMFLAHESKSCNDKGLLVQMHIEVFRIFRNACAGCQGNQIILCRESSVLQKTLRILTQTLSKSRDQDNLVLLRCCVQFLGNFTAGNAENAKSVIDVFLNSFRQLLNSGDVRLKEYTCMLIHSCICATDPATLLYSSEFIEILSLVIAYLANHDSEWSLFIIERMLQEKTFLENIWSKLENEERTLILTIISKTGNDKATPNPSETTHQSYDLPSEHIKFLCDQYNAGAHSILSLSQQTATQKLEPVLYLQVLSLLIDILSSKNMGHANMIREDKELLKCSINLLHCIHMIGKEGGNLFAEKNKLADSMSTSEDNPAVGLKRDLIRLIANMCHKHKPNQDCVREMGGISLIMNHTNIDSRNPFITQWAILAIRNLCENNDDNKAVIAGMKLEGMADNLETLKSFGIDAELEHGKVIIKNLPKDK